VWLPPPWVQGSSINVRYNWYQLASIPINGFRYTSIYTNTGFIITIPMGAAADAGCGAAITFSC
jgi:hypothetical protein